MDGAWFGFVRLLFFVGFGIAVLVKGWKSRKARHDRSSGEDYLLLLGSGLVLALSFFAIIYLSLSKGSGGGTAERYLGFVLLLLLAAGLTYGSNRIVRHKGKEKRGKDSL
jgi:drug/metabolite transporter (DMT)-like permease